MSFTDFIAISSLTLLAIGVSLEAEEKLYRKNIGHLLTVSSIIGVIYSGWKIAGEPLNRVSLGPTQFAEFVLAGGVLGLAYWCVVDRWLKEKLNDLSDAINHFRSELQKNNVKFIPSSRKEIAREYHRQFGKNAARLLRRTADPDFKALVSEVSSPQDFAGFERASIYLRAAGLSLPHHRWHRAFRVALGGALISAAIFFTFLALFSMLPSTTATVAAGTNVQEQVRGLSNELSELRANQWPTLTPNSIDAISKALAAVGRHQYDLVFNNSPDCLSFASGLRAAFDKASWTQVVETPDNAYLRAWSVPAPPGWAVNGFDDDAAMYALHDAIKSTLHTEIPTGRYSAPKDHHYISIRIGQKPFELQLSQVQ